jgi:hypothetical protein
VQVRFAKRKRLVYLLLLLQSVLFIFAPSPLNAQRTRKTDRDTLSQDQKSQKFYDSVYNKFNRNKFTRLLYPIAFRAPSKNSNDPLRTEKSETPYLPYAGKVIRNITVRTLAPFGTSLTDTAWASPSRAIGTLNKAHINTKAHVIRKELRFHRGDTLDPGVMADNERIIRELSYIDNVRFFIEETYPGSDTVDIRVIVKDVFSIGIHVGTTSTSKFAFSLYDANFLGLGDKISISMSMAMNRAPFFRVDGLNYSYRNIAGSFINGTIGFSQDDYGNQNFTTGLSRDFVTFATRWAGALNFSQSRHADEQSDSLTIFSKYQEELGWLGISYPLTGARRQTRFILAESVYNKYFLDRPYVTPGTDQFYFNATNILTGFSLSWNKYYTTAYIQEFGKPENLPYGRLVQLNIGPAITEFYTRMYASLNYSAGDLLGKFGYLSGSGDIGGFATGNHLEDCVLKVGLNYMTNLFVTKDKRYKFRGFLSGRYELGFNRTPSNQDFYDLNTFLQISGLNGDTIMQGTQGLALMTTTSIFTPLKWYGFRFAFSGFIEAGITAVNDNLWKNGSIYGGFGAGIMIKNDNLVFPVLYINLSVYPGNQAEVPGFGFNLTSKPTKQIPNFIPQYPDIETLGN